MLYQQCIINIALLSQQCLSDEHPVSLEADRTAQCSDTAAEIRSTPQLKDVHKHQNNGCRKNHEEAAVMTAAGQAVMTTAGQAVPAPFPLEHTHRRAVPGSSMLIP